MEIWLNFDGDPLRLPVLPSTVEIQVGHNNQEVNINEIGDINLMGKTGLKTLTLSSFFPAQEYYFVEYTGFPDPRDFIQEIDGWRLSGEPTRLILTMTGINMLVTIESLTYGEQDGTGDIYYALELKEYRQLKTRRTVKTKVPEPKRPVKKAKKKSKTYVVKRGDNLWNIAKRFYGKGNQWRKIYNKNKSVIGSNPNLIYPGQKYTIP